MDTFTHKNQEIEIVRVRPHSRKKPPTEAPKAPAVLASLNLSGRKDARKAKKQGA